MEGHLGIGDLNDHRLVLFPGLDVCIPRIAKHFADNCKLLVGIECGREDFEEFCILFRGERLHVSTANNGVCVKMVDMRNFDDNLLFINSERIRRRGHFVLRDKPFRLGEYRQNVQGILISH